MDDILGLPGHGCFSFTFDRFAKRGASRDIGRHQFQNVNELQSVDGHRRRHPDRALCSFLVGVLTRRLAAARADKEVVNLDR